MYSSKKVKRIPTVYYSTKGLGMVSFNMNLDTKMTIETQRAERFDANRTRPLTRHRLNSAVSREVTWPT